MNKLLPILGLAISFTALSCAQQQSKEAVSPAGYDLTQPEKYAMPDILQEISGFAFKKGESKLVYAQQDEEGAVFKLPIGTKNETKTRFSANGDYEDISIIKDNVIVLKSNGDLSVFPLAETSKAETSNVKVTTGLLPKGEYEGMYGFEATGDVYVLCKSCKKDKGTKTASGYVLTLQPDRSFKTKSEFSVDVSKVDQLSGKKKGKFNPSALAINPLTNEWYILSSVNKALLVADDKWNIKDVYHLSSNEFNQPEGIAFDKIGNLYISNEGSETTLGNILRFDYKKAK